MRALAVWVLVATMLSGCAAVPRAAHVAPAGGASSTAPPFALWLAPQLALAPQPPKGESTAAPTSPATGPWSDDSDYPQWKGVLASPAGLNGSVTMHLFVTTNTMSLAASAFPAFGQLPGIQVEMKLGDVSLEGTAKGPAYLRQGDVSEIVVQLKPVKDAALPTVAPAGTAIAVYAIPYYSHVQGAAEFRIVMGGEHASRLAST